MINGIKTDKLETDKTQVLSTPALRSDFKGVVNLYQDMICQKNLTARAGRDSHIAAVTTGGGKEVVPDMSYQGPILQQQGIQEPDSGAACRLDFEASAAWC